MKLSLVITQGKEQGKAIPIRQAQFLIGRDAQCQLRPASPLVSKRHCALLLKNDKAYVRDLGSTNGTLVNDVAVKGEVELHNGDGLKIGPIQFIVRLEAAAKKPSGSGAGTPLPVKALSGGDDDAIAAMLLDVEEGEVKAIPDASRAPGDAVPDGNTVVMPLSGEPQETKAGQPAEKKKDAPKAAGDTSKAAKAILDKYTRRSRS